MKINFSKLVFICFLFLVVGINSCKKEQADTETQSAVDNSICEGEFSRLFSQTHSIAVNDSGVQRVGFNNPSPFSACPDIIIDSANGFPVTLWMYYGSDNDGDGLYEVGCTGSDGKLRQGVVKAVFDKSWTLPGVKVTHTLENYFVNGIKYEGTVVITKTGNVLTQTVTNGKCSLGTDWSVLWNCAKTISVEIGQDSIIGTNDDVTYLSGTANGTDRNGKNFSTVIDSPLKRLGYCAHIVQGIQTVKLDGKKDRTIDYGNGTCDNIATLTIAGNKFEFKLQ